MSLSTIQKDWIRLDKQIQKAEQHLRTLKGARLNIKTDVLAEVGYAGLSNEALTAEVLKRK